MSNRFSLSLSNVQLPIILRDNKFPADIINPRSISDNEVSSVSSTRSSEFPKYKPDLSSGSFTSSSDTSSSETQFSSLVSNYSEISRGSSDFSGPSLEEYPDINNFENFIGYLEDDEFIFIDRDPKNSDKYKIRVTAEPPKDSLLLSDDPNNILYKIKFEPEGTRVPDYVKAFLKDIKLRNYLQVIDDIHQYLEDMDVMNTQTFSFDGFLNKISKLKGNQAILLSPKGVNEFTLKITDDFKEGIRLSQNKNDELYY